MSAVEVSLFASIYVSVLTVGALVTFCVLFCSFSRMDRDSNKEFKKLEVMQTLPTIIKKKCAYCNTRIKNDDDRRCDYCNAHIS